MSGNCNTSFGSPRFNLLSIVLLIMLGMLATTLVARAEEIEWFRQFGTSSADRASGVEVDHSGNIYVAGNAGGALPGQTYAGSVDAFVRAYDAAGNERWTRQFGTSDGDSIRDLAVDGYSNVYVAGDTSGALPGQTSAGSYDAFVRAYDAAGNERWTRQFGTSSASPGDLAQGIAADANGNVFVVGSTDGALPGQTYAGATDAFVRAYDADGNERWTRQFGTSNGDSANRIAVDHSGNIYVAGIVRGALPGQTGDGSGDAFVRTYDADGNERWTRQISGINPTGTPSSEGAYGIGVDASGNVYVTGTSTGDLPGQPPIDDCVGAGTYVRAYDGDGNERWTRKFCSTQESDPAEPFDLTVAANGDVYVVGYTDGTLPGQTTTGSADAFVYACDANGNERWTRQIGTSGADEGLGIAVDSNFNVYMAGHSSGEFPGQGNAGHLDAFIAKISDIPTFVVDAGGPFEVNEGGIVSIMATSNSPDTDSLVYAWDLDDNGSFETPGQSVIFSAATLDGPSTHTVAVQATDPRWHSATDTASVVVGNVVPTVGPITAPLDPKGVNTVINASANFTDPGMLDTHTALWDWGDDVTSNGVVTESNGSGSVTGTHAYATPGNYTITLTVTDKDGGAGTSIFQFVIIYDASGGFVTGTGWINSPPGAYVPAPEFTGKVTFSFVSKYRKGSNAPTGNTELQFKAGGLNFKFKSTTYDWLVVAGAKAQLKGVGTINGAGEFGFMLTAVDGQVNGGGGTDKFRIKIWDKATGDIVYDNQMGATDDAQPNTVVGGGSIVVHK